MVHALRRVASAFAVRAACAPRSGCLIDGLSGGTAAGLATLTATATLQQPAACVVDAASQRTTCSPVITAGFPGGGVQTSPVSITLLGHASPLALYDPLIVQVPASMSDVAGSIAFGPPGVAPGTPLQITAGLTSVPIDATTSLLAEAGMQLVIIDFQAPANAPFGRYGLQLQFRGTANSVKLGFAGTLTTGAQAAAAKAATDCYLPLFPCVTRFADVPAIPIPLASPAQLLPLLATTTGRADEGYDLAAPPPPSR